MITIANVSTLFLSKNYCFLKYELVLSACAGYILFVRWKRTKRLLSKHDNIYNTGLWKPMILECLITLIQCYPSLYGHTYMEEYNMFDPDTVFITNDILLMLMIFMRIHFLVICILSTSFYTEPRSQRVCAIYGADANEMYAVKAIMVNNSGLIVLLSTLVSMIMFSY